MIIALWLGLNIMDLTTTLAALGQGVGEANPIMNNMEVTELVAYKIIVPFLVVMLLVQLDRLPLLKWLCLGMGLVVIWNLVWVV